MDAARARKLADRIARIVAEMLERRVKDPRLGFVTVTEARLTNDLREATVYYTVYGSAEEQAGTAAALASATGLIRSEIGRQTGLRHTPSVSFVRDTLPEGARHIEDLVAKARAADAALAIVRERALPAGDADPYRAPAGSGDGAGDEGAGGGAEGRGSGAGGDDGDGAGRGGQARGDAGSVGHGSGSGEASGRQAAGGQGQ